MNFKQALIQIQSRYEIRQITKDVFQILINQNLNTLNTCFVVIKNSEIPLLTDYGKTCELIDCNEETVKQICKQNNVFFNNYNIELPFENINDIEKIVKTIIQIKKF